MTEIEPLYQCRDCYTVLPRTLALEHAELKQHKVEKITDEKEP